MTLYVCPAGTSVARGPAAPQEDMAAYGERIRRRTAELRAKHSNDPRAMLIEISAETNGLARMDCGAGDEVLLLASDTEDGEACAHAVAGLVADVLGAKVQVWRLPGLTTAAQNSFRQRGIRSLLRAVRRALASTGQPGVVFNVTGGFKGVVPYLTLLGMFEGIEVVYVFENSDALIRLPPLPVTFDLEATAFAMPALLVLARREIMPLAEFNELLPGRGFNDDPVLEQLIEVAGNDCALSGAGELAVARFAPPETGAGRLFVRHQVLGSPLYENPAVQRNLKRITNAEFRRIPLNCAMMADSTDLRICKPMGQSAPRIYYRAQGVAGAEDVYVVDIVSHHEHEHVIQPGQRRIWWRDYADQRFDEVLPRRETGSDAWGESLSTWLEDRQAAIGSAAETGAELAEAVRKNQVLERRAERAERQREQGILRLVKAADFAAQAFRGKKRKDGETPYVNHLTTVVRLMAEAGVDDADILCAGYLHDAIEDVGVTGEEIERRFGSRVRALVEEVSDDKSLPKQTRKDLQISQAPDKSQDARLISLADKIATLNDLIDSPPIDWPADRIAGYFDWAYAVFLGLRGSATPAHGRLEEKFMQVLGSASWRT